MCTRNELFSYKTGKKKKVGYLLGLNLVTSKSLLSIYVRQECND